MFFKSRYLHFEVELSVSKIRYLYFKCRYLYFEVEISISISNADISILNTDICLHFKVEKRTRPVAADSGKDIHSMLLSNGYRALPWLLTKAPCPQYVLPGL